MTRPLTYELRLCRPSGTRLINLILPGTDVPGWRQEQFNVSVITYDELLDGQKKQAGRIVLPGDDDFTLGF